MAGQSSKKDKFYVQVCPIVQAQSHKCHIYEILMHVILKDSSLLERLCYQEAI